MGALLVVTRRSFLRGAFSAGALPLCSRLLPGRALAVGLAGAKTSARHGFPTSSSASSRPAPSSSWRIGRDGHRHPHGATDGRRR